MTTQILFPPEFDQLSDDDKKLVKDLMKSIVQAEEATDILLNLLGSKELDSDLPKFRESCQKHFNQELNLEILTSEPTPVLPNNNLPGASGASIVTNIKTFVEFLIGKSNAFKKAAKERCQKICENDPDPQKCINCLKSLNKS